MLKGDPWSNPGLLDADRGEAPWQEKREPRNGLLERCDLDSAAPCDSRSAKGRWMKAA